jgi:hypothetical protein
MTDDVVGPPELDELAAVPGDEREQIRTKKKRNT